jgi:hypothetical protein
VTPEEYRNHPGWRWCTAQGARDQVLLIGLETTFREKLEWLEEAETLALRLQASGKAARSKEAEITGLRDYGTTGLRTSVSFSAFQLLTLSPHFVSIDFSV